MAEDKVMNSNEKVEDVEAVNATDGAEAVVEDDVAARIAELEAQLAAAQAKADENWDTALRTKAESENIRRRAEKDVENAHKFAVEKFVNELIPVIDSIELGLAAVADESADIEKFREGSELTLKMMAGVMEKFTIVGIDPSGEKFDPAQHQAMSMQEQEGVEANTVLHVVQKGYTLNGRVLRPAMVIVSKAVTPPAADQTKFDGQA
jgi:molecular chaperone GrpE